MPVGGWSYRCGFGQQTGSHGLGGLMQERTLSRSGSCTDNLKSLFRGKEIPARSAGGKCGYFPPTPSHGRSDLGKGPFTPVQLIGTKAGGHPSGGSTGLASERRSARQQLTAILRFSLATLRR